MAEMVSPCCGAEYNIYITNKSPIRFEEESGLTCMKCQEQFSEPIEDYEYDEQMKEARDEDRADEARDMGL